MTIDTQRTPEAHKMASLVDSSIIPYRDRVLIESLPDDYRNSTFEGALAKSIIIPSDFHREVNRFGKVLALGSGRLQDGRQHRFTVQVGDVVWCQRYPASWQGIEGRLGTIRENEILGIVRD